MKKIFALLMALCMTLCIVPSAVFADESGAGALDRITVSINKDDSVLDDEMHVFSDEEKISIASGAYRTEAPQFRPSDGPNAGSSAAFDTVEEALTYLREHMALRDASISVPCNVGSGLDSNSINNIATYLFYSAFDHTGVPDQGDYLLWHLDSYYYPSASYSGEILTVTFRFNFRTTAEQERVVGAEIDRVLGTLDLEGKTDYKKFLAVYEYMTHNITYDYTSSDMMKHTAYAALINKTAVCQGYALLLYRMLLTIGIDCRFISGYGGDAENGGAHAWNIVRLGNYYYNVDSTWDASGIQVYVNGVYDHTEYPNTYMLRCDANFPLHQRDEQYATSEFYEAYPMSPRDFDPQTDDVEYIALVTEEDGKETYYANMSDAVNAAPDNSSVTLLKDITEHGFEHRTDRNISIDLGGHTYTIDEYGSIKISAGLVIMFNGTIDASCSQYALINSVDLGLFSVSILAEDSLSAAISNQGTLLLDDVYIDASCAIKNEGDLLLSNTSAEEVALLSGSIGVFPGSEI